ncbi:MAG TPA: glycosyltransferase [Candidatus Gastranaerophilales bacterium]|nr:glycosyltransferase [Candidatus Gastranaerophilales bacterium]
MRKKSKIAFIKYLGLITAGTEKFLQTIAAGLPKNEFEVDFYWAHPEEIPPDEGRIKYLQGNGVNLIEFKTSKPRVHRGKIWLDETNFFDVFKGADLIQTGRCGHFEEPFCSIKNIPIVDSYHYVVGVDNQYNTSRVMHISEFSKRKWIEMGGDESRIVMVSHPMIIPKTEFINYRQELGLENKFVFGFHQRNDDAIFSDIPLKAYKEVENDNNAFVLLGGGEAYKKQASELGLKNIYFLPHTGDVNKIHSFLQIIDVYAHGRKDGELNSTAIAEAMYYGKPIVSHYSDSFNGHVECIGNAGWVEQDYLQYAFKLHELEIDPGLYQAIQPLIKKQFNEMYDYKNQMQNIIKIYRDVIKNPYPNKLKRLYLDIKQQFPLRRHRRWN